MNPHLFPSDHAADFNAHVQADSGPGDFITSLGQSLLHHEPSFGPVVGTPGEDSNAFVSQTTGFTCDVVAQEMILHEFGDNASEAELVFEATRHNLLTSDGTTFENMGQLLELHGVHAHLVQDGSVDSLTDELSKGHKVIVAVDSSDLWDASLPLSHLFHSPKADHAIVVTGLDMSDPAHPKVVVNDPGLPNGAGNVYPLDQFLEAWSASGNTYVATNSAPPNLAQHMIFGANYHPENGMYMDKDFWAIFLKALAFDISSIAAQYVVSWASGPAAGPPDESGAPVTGRNGLF
jgi:hypothetical protein